MDVGYGIEARSRHRLVQFRPIQDGHDLHSPPVGLYFNRPVDGVYVFDVDLDWGQIAVFRGGGASGACRPPRGS